MAGECSATSLYGHTNGQVLYVLQKKHPSFENKIGLCIAEPNAPPILVLPCRVNICYEYLGQGLWPGLHTAATTVEPYYLFCNYQLLCTVKPLVSPSTNTHFPITAQDFFLCGLVYANGSNIFTTWPWKCPLSWFLLSHGIRKQTNKKTKNKLAHLLSSKKWKVP